MSKPETFDNLDSLRGICALLVALFHVGWANHLSLSPLVSNGWLFVDFFFTLSGFVIAHSYLPITSAAQLKVFMVRRLFRLYPLHVVTLLLAAAATAAGAYMKSPRSFSILEWVSAEVLQRPFVDTALLVQALGFSTPTFNTPSWSISAELWTYVLFGLLGLVFRSAARTVAAMAVVGAIAYAYLIVGNWPLGAYTALEFGLPRCIGSFALGAVVCWLCAGRGRTIAGSRMLPVYLLAFAAIYAVLSSVGTNSPANMLAIPLFAVVIGASVLDGGSPVRRFLEAGMPRYLGKLSYSIYMVHTTVGMVVSLLVSTFSPQLKAKVPGASLLAGDLYCLLYLVLIVAVSSVTFALIEQPWRELGRAASRPRSRATAAV